MENFEVIGKIGKGSFGIVSKIRRKLDGKILVWKEIDYSNLNDNQRNSINTEISILKNINHHNVVKYYDRLIDKNNTHIYIIMEYCEGGDLDALLKECLNKNDYLPEEIIWKVFYQILSALDACHNHKNGKILHRDIKAANVFIDNKGIIKLGDFGLSKIMDGCKKYADTQVGTPYYMSPELITKSKYNEKSDIWAAGCLLYEMAALNPPFKARCPMELWLKIKEGKFDRIPARYSENLQNFIEQMLKNNPEERPSVEVLLTNKAFSKWNNQHIAKEKEIISQAQQKGQITKSLDENLKKEIENLKENQKILSKKVKNLENLVDNMNNFNRIGFNPVINLHTNKHIRLRTEGISPLDHRPIEKSNQNLAQKYFMRMRADTAQTEFKQKEEKKILDWSNMKINKENIHPETDKLYKEISENRLKSGIPYKITSNNPTSIYTKSPRMKKNELTLAQITPRKKGENPRAVSVEPRKRRPPLSMIQQALTNFTTNIRGQFNKIIS